jgi:hypothetical protein
VHHTLKPTRDEEAVIREERQNILRRAWRKPQYTGHRTGPGASPIVIDDLGDGVESDFDDLAVGALDFDAGFGESLRRLHAFDDAAHARAVLGYDLYVVFAVERLQGSERFNYFHVFSLILSSKQLPVAYLCLASRSAVPFIDVREKFMTRAHECATASRELSYNS